jgi:polar amino acid transport system ATP-binding protein/sulfate transport system ATP-binding protein/NitT/TauT family transport system ATP-binding protein
LLDEPFSGLDVFMIDKVVDTLVKVSLSDELKTLVIVSHNLADSIAISDTVFVMNVEPEKPGATIVKEIDLIERDLAYHKDIKYTPQFIETLKEVKNYMA